MAGELCVRDIMTKDVVTVPAQASLRDAMEFLARTHVSGAPVVVGRDVVGVISTSDLMSFVASAPGVPTETEAAGDWSEWADVTPEEIVEMEDESATAFYAELWDDSGVDASKRMEYVEGPEWNALEQHDVSEVMTRELVIVQPEASVSRAAHLMLDKSIHRVLVMQNGELMGIVTTTDIARVVAEGAFGF